MLYCSVKDSARVLGMLEVLHLQPFDQSLCGCRARVIFKYAYLK